MWLVQELVLELLPLLALELEQVLELALVLAAASGALMVVVPAEVLCEEQVEVRHCALAVAAFVGVPVVVAVVVFSTMGHPKVGSVPKWPFLFIACGHRWFGGSSWPSFGSFRGLSASGFWALTRRVSPPTVL